MLQMYQLIDDRAEGIAQAAQELGAAIDALRSGRTREFLKNAMAVPVPVEGTSETSVASGGK